MSPQSEAPFETASAGLGTVTHECWFEKPANKKKKKRMIDAPHLKGATIAQCLRAFYWQIDNRDYREGGTLS